MTSYDERFFPSSKIKGNVRRQWYQLWSLPVCRHVFLRTSRGGLRTFSYDILTSFWLNSLTYSRFLLMVWRYSGLLNTWHLYQSHDPRCDTWFSTRDRLICANHITRDDTKIILNLQESATKYHLRFSGVIHSGSIPSNLIRIFFG